jgi:hypothetical protein
LAGGDEIAAPLPVIGGEIGLGIGAH